MKHSRVIVNVREDSPETFVSRARSRYHRIEHDHDMEAFVSQGNAGERVLIAYALMELVEERPELVSSMTVGENTYFVFTYFNILFTFYL